MLLFACNFFSTLFICIVHNYLVILYLHLITSEGFVKKLQHQIYSETERAWVRIQRGHKW
jgi:hypothetical protein